jgi:hypothetical protein
VLRRAGLHQAQLRRLGDGATSNGGNTVTLTDATTSTSPDLFILRHVSTVPAGIVAGFGVTSAVEVSVVSGNVLRISTDIVDLKVATPDGSVWARRRFRVMVAGALADHLTLDFVAGSALNPVLYLGNPADITGILRATNELQVTLFGATQLRFTGNDLIVGASIGLFMAGRIKAAQQAATIPCAATITLAADGNGCLVSVGTGTLSSIVVTGWPAGSSFTLVLAAGITITSGTAGTGATIITPTGASIGPLASKRAIDFYYDGLNVIVKG